MSFFAILTKEMRLRMRQERTTWIMIVYVVLLSLLGWFYLSHTVGRQSTVGYDWSAVGAQLYQLLTVVAILLIILITPSFTSGSINAEKEDNTYDILICSQIPSFSLVTGKLIAGLSNALLLIAASIPLFSLVFFFGGFTPIRLVKDFIVFAMTAALVASFGLLCSTLFAKRSTSTTITYMTVLLWLLAPISLFLEPIPMIIDHTYLHYSLSNFVWNPVAILFVNGDFSYPSNVYSVAGINISAFTAYIILSVGATLLFFLLSICFVKPHLLNRIRTRCRAYIKKSKKNGK